MYVKQVKYHIMSFVLTDSAVAIVDTFSNV